MYKRLQPVPVVNLMSLKQLGFFFNDLLFFRLDFPFLVELFLGKQNLTFYSGKQYKSKQTVAAQEERVPRNWREGELARHWGERSGRQLLVNKSLERYVSLPA